jgi:uncharacterized membrane protein
MRMARWGLSTLFGLMATLSVGVGQASSQTTLIRVCNNTNVVADVAVTGLQSGVYVIKGWWPTGPGECRNTTYVENGWTYLYAMNEPRRTSWGGNEHARRFCIVFAAMERVISPQFTCAAELLRTFSGYFVEGGTFTWNLNP